MIELNIHPNPPPSLILEKGEGRERDEYEKYFTSHLIISIIMFLLTTVNNNIIKTIVWSVYEKYLQTKL
jgi:hypothetical protein